MVETIQTGGDFHRRLIGDTIRRYDGYITAATAPGLGIAFDESLARAHPWQGLGLHLEMCEAPCDYFSENVFLGGAPPVTDDPAP